MSVRASVELSTTKKGKARYFQTVFLDSYQHLSSSRGILVDTVDHLPFMRARFSVISDAVLRRKDGFPYSCFHSPSR